MGHLVNPISYQLGYTRFWLSTWASGKFSAGLSRTGILTRYDYKIVQFISQILGKVNRIFLCRSTLGANRRLTRARKAVRCFFYKTKLYRSGGKLFVILFLWTNLRLILSRLTRRVFLSDPIRPLSGAIQAVTNKSVVIKKKRLIAASRHKKKYPGLFRKTLSSFSGTLLLRFLKSMLAIKRIQVKNCLVRSVRRGGSLRRIILTRLIQLSFCNLRLVLESALQKLHVGSIHRVLFNCNRKPVISASFLVRYIALILITTRRPVQRLFYSIGRYLRLLMKKRKLMGFKILCAGRFARRGRAGLAYKSAGLSSSTTTLHRTDFAFSTVLLTNSICGLKVWLSVPNHSPLSLN